MQLIQTKQHLENEKTNFLIIMNEFIDNMNLEDNQFQGRPRTNFKDILKSLLVMSFHGMSYRRANSDIEKMFYDGFIRSIPKRSTLCKYMLEVETAKILERLISLSARTFLDVEDTVLIDSTWFGNFMPLSGRHKRKVGKVWDYRHPLDKTRKLHVMCFLKSQVIICARASSGKDHDSPFLKEMLNDVIKQGFKIKTFLGDAGYVSKNHMALFESYGIKNVFIDFKKNSTIKYPKSFLWKERFNLYKNQPDVWHETYRFRVMVENLFSSMKRKGKNYIRCRDPNSRDAEVLLKALWHNFTIIAKFMDSLEIK